MGRWAEVYFTSPPEKRDAAVLDLLHKLQTENSKPDSGTPGKIVPWPEAPASNAPPPPPRIASALTTIEEPTVQCSSCGHENSAFHRFCGGCGTPLTGELPAEPSHSTMSSSAEQNSKVEDAVSSQPETASHQPAAIEDIRAKLDPQRREFEESIAHPHELSLFRSFREQDSSDNDWDEAPPRRRFYLGAALAILTAGAIYMAWRSGQLSAQRPHEAKPAPAIVAPDSSASGQNPNTNVSEQKAAPQTSQAQTPATAKNGEPHPPENSLPASDHREKSIQRVSSVTEQTPAPQPLIDNGKEELAVAERYLNGTNGQRRDSGEAAKWLWKSISKHNGEASVLLADLYLKGDGVSKNCDQARVLLDTAGRKGVAGAGMRLRNLQAFGCQ